MLLPSCLQEPKNKRKRDDGFDSEDSDFEDLKGYTGRLDPSSPSLLPPIPWTFEDLKEYAGR